MKEENPIDAINRKKVFKRFLNIAIVMFCIMLAFGIFNAFVKARNTTKLALDNVDLIQYKVPADNTPVAVFETDKGTFKAVIYEKEAPNTAKYFIDLVNKGYYNGTYVFAVQNGVYFMGGSKTKNGVTDADTDESAIERELTPNLWPFKGAMISYGNEGGSVFSKHTLSGSRMLFVNSVEFTDEFKKEIDSIKGGNKDIINAFKKHGGIPNFSQQYTIFGQIYDGMEIYDEICKAEVTDSESLQPKEELKFNKVYMSTYGENKNDSAFDN